MNKRLEEIRKRDALLDDGSVSKIKSDWENNRDSGIVYLDRRTLLDLVDTQAAQIEELDNQLIKAKDWSTHYFAESLILERQIAEGRGAFAKWLGECPTCGVQPNFGEEINHWDSCKYNEWLKEVAE
ncbi:hypothetical protein LCGC14_2810540 [marine sediment metagenome]|uniref:Uncharacterized protein n=1 Tax=marine sediment metagenome TaxID=412755 RepID=A0A0F8Z6T0_9ZZZZ